VDERHHPRNQDDPPAENDPLVAGDEESEAVKDPSHVTPRDVSTVDPRLSPPSLGHRLGADNVLKYPLEAKDALASVFHSSGGRI
jgi:hypothetical protein